MIKEKDLREMRPQYRYQNGQTLTLEVVQNALKNAAQQHQIPVAFYSDEIKSGGLFNSIVEPCIVLYHPEHQKDYFKLAIRVSHQGSYAFITVNDFGESTQLGNASSSEFVKETMKHGSGGEKAAALLGAGTRMLLKGRANKQKLAEEQNWYAMVTDLLNEIIS